MEKEMATYLAEKFCATFEDMVNSGVQFPQPLPESLQRLNTALHNHLGPTSALTTTHLVKKESIENLYRLNTLLMEIQKLSPDSSYYHSHLHSRVEDLKIQLPSYSGDIFYKPSSGWVDASKVHGFDDEVVALEKVLLPNKLPEQQRQRLRSIGVTGSVGIGKTTLCQVTYNTQAVKNHFFPRIWLHMKSPADPIHQYNQHSINSNKDNNDNNNSSRDRKRAALIVKMLMSLGVDYQIINSVANKKGLKGLLYALYLELVGKRYLIVLDDAKDPDSWYNNNNREDLVMGHRLADGLPKGGTVIVTSRDEKLAKQMVGEEEMVHHLLPLADPESSWLIYKTEFEQRTGNTIRIPGVGQDDKEAVPAKDDMEAFLALKRNIMEKSAGIPLVSKMMARAVPLPELLKRLFIRH